MEKLKPCPTCGRGDVWQEAVSRTQYVYGRDCEPIDYLLAEVQQLLGTEAANREAARPREQALESLLREARMAFGGIADDQCICDLCRMDANRMVSAIDAALKEEHGNPC